jgi:hypothetical protein
VITSNIDKPLYPDIESRKLDKINTRISIKISPINDEAKAEVSGLSRAYLEFRVNNRTNELLVETTGLSYDGSPFNVEELLDALNLIKDLHNKEE